MAYASEPDLLVLHTSRLKGFAETETIVEHTGLPRDDVSKYLDVFEAAGSIIYRSGKVSGWTLTAAGRAEDERRLAVELDAAGARPAVEHGYQRFLECNAEVLQLCTDWQVREAPEGRVINDHADRAYDDSVVARLVQLDRKAQPITRELGVNLERFASYGARLSTAVYRVVRGEKDWFTKPTIDSYHTVWFELHENLLATLGIERGKETS